jgi:hypothetical protein
MDVSISPPHVQLLATFRPGGSMADEDLTAVPNSDEPEEERKRIRQSNDRDQKLEREGVEAPHNRGYDEAADGAIRPPRVDHVADEP